MGRCARSIAVVAAALAASALGVVSEAAAPLSGGAVRVSPAAGQQNEPTIGVDPVDPRNLVAGSIDDAQCGVYRSGDRGETWAADVLQLSADAPFTNAGDPVVEFAADGTAYFLCMNTANSNAQKSQYVYRSSDGGATWSAPVLAISPTFGNDDKGHIVADNHPASPHFGNVYVAATALGSGALRFARSTDGAQSFAAPITVNDANIGFAVNLAVGADGAVYAAWSREATVGVSNAVLVDRSDDGGASFGALSGGTDHVIQSGGIVLGGVRAEPNRGNGFPYIGTHPSDPNLVYAVWAEDAPGVDDSDIHFSRSTDRGETWSPSVRLNTDVNPPGDFASQFWPTLAVDPVDGEIDVIWYSDELDPDRTDGTRLIDLFMTSSIDGGLTFASPARVTRTSSTPFGFFGDYLGIDAFGGVAHAIWTDTTFTPGNQDVATAQIGGADLSITKTESSDPAIAGSTLTYTLTVANTGPADARDVKVVDHLPAGVTVTSASAPCVGAVGAVTCELGTVPATSTRTVQIEVAIGSSLVHDAGSAVTIINTASVSSDQPDPDSGNDVAIESTTVVASTDLAATMLVVDAPSDAVIGSPVTSDVSVQIANLGPSSPVDATVDVTVSTGAGVVAAPVMQTASVADVAVGTPRTVTVPITVTCVQPGQHIITVTASASPSDADTSDPDPSNDTATTTHEIDCVVPVAINVRPGSPTNPVALGSGGVIPVAVLSTQPGEYGLPLAVDATSIDPSTVRFGTESVVAGGGGAGEVHGRGHPADSYELDETTRDGDLDLVLHFRIAESSLVAGSGTVCVRGTLSTPTGPASFLGCDTVHAVPS